MLIVHPIISLVEFQPKLFFCCCCCLCCCVLFITQIMGCAFLKDFINSSEGSLNGTRIRGRESGTLNNPSPVMRSRSMMERFMRNRERAQISASDSISPSTRLLLRAPFSNFSCFSQQIYLTGWGGITLDNLKQYNIKGLFNVTYEINDPLSGIKNPSIEHHKYPVG